jgi:succinate dehydrogenase/fumarate reductase flavoprotein subunit
MSLRKADGLWPTNHECASTVPGLYAAGDSLYTIQNGAAYASLGSSMAGSAITGGIAGTAAAKEALGGDDPHVDNELIGLKTEAMLAPAKRPSGYSPRWVTQLLQNTMMPYFISFVQKEDRLQAALTIVMFIKEHLVPMLAAGDPHELRLALETANMVLSAEMRLRSSIFRTESRGNHYREDYPDRQDPEWLAWTVIEEQQGEMNLKKVPIPEDWRPDLSKPYEDRYTFRFPGESAKS